MIGLGVCGFVPLKKQFKVHGIIHSERFGWDILRWGHITQNHRKMRCMS